MLMAILAGRKLICPCLADPSGIFALGHGNFLLLDFALLKSIEIPF
ncbi:hypothetical protein [Rhizobium sp. TRM95796]|nr:hypothetical protein [Rhizobium sp. TRM95796]MCV3766870.1 hypothetical protein [Rhizobium sp. TRM95796]